MLGKIKLSGIEKESIVDGNGIRYTVFVQGCPHNCEGCHNPQTHNFSLGYYHPIESMVDDIKKNPLLAGATFSGGEPFCQAEALIEFAKELKKLGKNIWAYSGYTYDQLIGDIMPHTSELLSYIDVLVDGPFILKERDLTLKFRGSRNQRLIDLNKTRINNNITLLE